MKKRLVVLLTAALMLASTSTFMAAPSASSDDVVVGTVEELEEAIEGAESEAGEVTVATVTDKAAVDNLDDAILGIIQTNTADVKAKALAMADLSLPAGTDLSAGVKIKLTVDGIYSTDSVNTINALHWNGTAWETVKVVAVERGAVTIEVTSLSPIAIVKVIPAAGTFGVSFSVLPLVAAASLTGAVVAGKKANK